MSVPPWWTCLTQHLSLVNLTCFSSYFESLQMLPKRFISPFMAQCKQNSKASLCWDYRVSLQFIQSKISNMHTMQRCLKMLVCHARYFLAGEPLLYLQNLQNCLYQWSKIWEDNEADLMHAFLVSKLCAPSVIVKHLFNAHFILNSYNLFRM